MIMIAVFAAGATAMLMGIQIGYGLADARPKPPICLCEFPPIDQSPVIDEILRGIAEDRAAKEQARNGSVANIKR